MTESRRTRLAALLLPREHGSWSLAFEPIALGLLAAPSVAGALLSLAAAVAFLARRPAQGVAGRFGGARQAEAAGLLALLGGIAVAAVLAAGWLGGWVALAPLVGALVPAAVFLGFDAHGESRAAVAELAGAATFAFVPATSALLAGHGWPVAVALGALALLRSAPAVLVVRTYLRRRRGEPSPAAPALGASLVATAGVALLAHAQLATAAVVGVAVVLLARSLWLLGRRAPALRAPQLGLLEAALGVAFVLAAGLGRSL